MRARRLPRLATALALALGLAAPACEDRPNLSSAQEAQLAAYISDTVPPGLTTVDVDFDGKIHLVGYALSPRQAIYPAGSRVTLLLAWRCDQPLDDGWEQLTHLVAQDGRVVTKLDDSGPLRRMPGFKGPPLPPSRWRAGKYYLDELTFTVPGEPSPVFTVAAGFVKGTDRLPIQGAGGDGEHRTQMIELRTGRRTNKPNIKEVSPQRLPAGTALAIDGRLDEPAWQSAAKAGPFVDVGTGRENRVIPSQGSARLLWDDAFFYVGFEVLDKRVAGGFPQDAKDPHLWEKDTVEIMIDPDGDGDNKDYYEIQINPQNLVFDSQFDDYNAPNGGGKGPFGHEEWTAGLTSAVQVLGTMDNDADVDQGYTVEAKIPWSSFSKAQRSPPAPGDAWRMNFYAMQNNGGTGWSPLFGEGNFHRARRFGRVRFAAGDGADAGAPPTPPTPPAPSGSASAGPPPKR